ncbi:hypothetical protein [uncultured Roseobacter sp.]|uniref:hypothetical protein n=1 Tax=uncultured Roseobacter sp. TaxID=114847 RepID=UPI002639E983|nr:hypothetical protein [uncultured Roseobacter sp.]
MTIHTANNDSFILAASLDLLKQHRISLQTGSDFEEYRTLLEQGRPDHELGAPFDPRLHNLNASNAVWVIGRDEDGTIMHAQALRMLDTGALPLSEYLRRRFHEFPPSGLDIDYERSRYRAGPGAHRIRGRVCYHGEVWMGGAPGKYRGSGLSCVLGRYAFLTAMQLWAPDYVIGFMPRPVAFKGFAERQGYMHAEPGCLRWFLRGGDKPLEGFMVYMSNEDIRFVLDMPLSELIAQAA